MTEYKITVQGMNIGSQHIIDGQDPDGGPWWTDDIDVARAELARLKESSPQHTFRLDPDPRDAYSPIPEVAQAERSGARIEYRVRWKRAGSGYGVSRFDSLAAAEQFADTMYPRNPRVPVRKDRHAHVLGVEWRPVWSESGSRGGRRPGHRAWSVIGQPGDETLAEFPPDPRGRS